MYMYRYININANLYVYIHIYIYIFCQHGLRCSDHLALLPPVRVEVLGL